MHEFSPGLFVRSFLALQHIDPGFTAEGVLAGWVSVPQESYPDAPRQEAFQRAWLERIQALLEVESAGLANLLPLSGQQHNCFDIEGRTLDPSEQLPAVQYRAVSAHYLRTLRARLLQGRMLQESDDRQAPWALVINQTFARLYWPHGNALGKRLRVHAKEAQWATIVGILDDLHETGIPTAAQPTAYWALTQRPALHLGLVVRPTTVPLESLRPSIEAARAVDKDIPLHDVAPLTRVVNDSLGARRLSALRMGLFAGAALLLAALGIAGVKPRARAACSIDTHLTRHLAALRAA
ncbi:ABC transporter permease [Corallococcus sp. M34]|uniref:ABC transporter permease n=1 Tax=Citreicoccus inhibens TaxID=2849499 RepID=UPI001C23C774|nr:ABC transporter permease [Citreicoccus inhibens]MBU8899594.1 ABC transporter permease [Citreicoccus inhibens]